MSQPDLLQEAALHTLLITLIATVAVLEPCLNPQPYHTSALSGHAWVQKLMDGHPSLMKDELGA